MTLNEKLHDIVARKSEGIEAMKAILDSADSESRDLTEQEEKDYQYLDNEVERLKKEETRIHKLITDDTVLATPQKTVRTYIAKKEAPEEFRSLGEFLSAVRFNPADPRLNYVETGSEKRQQSMGIGVEGGFAVPTQFIPELKMVDPQAAIIRPRATVIPPGDPPDATTTLPALNQSTASNIYGGMAVNWISEGASKPETDLELLEICLTPHEVAGYTIITDKLLRNWGAAESVVSNMLRLCVRGAEDTAFLSGTGVGQPLGVINSPARINVARAGAGAIAFADVYNMLSNAKFGGSLVWIGNQTILPQLITMADGGGNSVWLPGTSSSINAGAANSPPGTLFGIPLVFNERSPALGAIGDLILCDFGYYLIKDGSGPFVAISPHVHFLTNRTVIKIFWNVDGQPWLTTPIPMEGGGGNVSPFVVLN